MASTYAVNALIELAHDDLAETLQLLREARWSDSSSAASLYTSATTIQKRIVELNAEIGVVLPPVDDQPYEY